MLYTILLYISGEWGSRKIIVVYISKLDEIFITNRLSTEITEVNSE